MRSRWTLAVTDLGPIKRAEIVVRPLMLFVGHNNSGKSYLASLLWYILARLSTVLSAEGLPTSGAGYAACDQWLADKIARTGEEATFALSEADCRLLLGWLNEWLREQKDSIVRHSFIDPAMRVGSIEILDVSIDKPIQLRIRRHPPGSGAFLIGPKTKQPGELEFVISNEQGFDPKMLRSLILVPLIMEIFFFDISRHIDTQYFPGDPIYLPASRTGFMLLYKGVVSGLLDQLGGPRPSQPAVRLTTPSLHFLQLLAVGLKANEQGKFGAEADFLEQQSFPGTVALGGGVGVNDVEYRYAAAQPPLPMQLASSLVTELAPIVLVLRHVPELPLLIIEEPEAHLHPHLQRVLAQTIARLIRKGLFVWITTHSENFCQQINNFIKLGSLPEPKRAALQQRFGYDAQDYLTTEEVAGYQLRVEPKEGRSSVARLDMSESGLAMPTFNEELFKLSEEALTLSRAVEGDG